MARVFIPTMLRDLADGNLELKIDGKNVREVVDLLDAKFPGFKLRILEDGQLRSNIVVAVDAETSRLGLLEKLHSDSEVHFIPAIGGGSQ